MLRSLLEIIWRPADVGRGVGAWQFVVNILTFVSISYLSVVMRGAAGQAASLPDIRADRTEHNLSSTNTNTLHTGNPGIRKSKKFISLNIAFLVGVKTDLVGAWVSMEGSIIKN